MKIQILDKGYITLIDYMGTDRTIAETALMTRRNTIQDKDHIRRIIEDLLDKKHLSPFEQVQFRFEIKCPLFVRSQWMRHRTQSYQEESRRHITDDPDFYIPATYNREHYELFYPQILTTYHELLEWNEVPERARMVLPQAMYTTFVTSVNARNLMDFLRQRCAPGAQWEIRQYAYAIRDHLFPVALPITAAAWITRNP